MINELRKELKKLSNKDRAVQSSRYFKTGKGEYGEGDVFIGLNLVDVTQLAKKYKDLTFPELQELLSSKIHEERTLALFVLKKRFEKETLRQKQIYDFYLKNTRNINNWDLVDISAPRIVGGYLIDKPKDILFKLVKSKSIWERRIAVLSSFYFIKNGEYDISLKIAEMLLSDREDLIQKAVGWMLREIGKKDSGAEEKFLKKYHRQIGRTAFRCAIEKFPEEKRLKYLKGEI